MAVKIVLAVAAPPAKVYDALTRDIGRWWDPAHTYSGDSRNLSLEARPGGCFCEQLPAGGGVEHGRVVLVMPGKRLRLAGGLGPLQESGVSGALTWDVAEREGATELTLTYAVGGYRQGGLQGLAPIVDSVLAGQVRRLKSFAEKGTPTP
jgi:uncharacterized protein YndB with AHSA1/START domain